MQRMAAGILKQYGTELTLEHGGNTVSFKGFFQPVRSKSWQSAVSASTPLGEVPRRLYVCICPPETAAKAGDVLTLGEKTYFLRRVEPYYYGEEILYLWALCMEKGGDESWMTS